MTRRTATGLIFSASAGSQLSAAEVPRPGGDLSIALPAGNVVKLSQYRGKVLAFSCILTS
ncbi:MAG: hypothetical protein FJW31_01855 [Acidobacteria bacterium]|nr:hypothetical protein [Acidobacteriota bacterium]